METEDLPVRKTMKNMCMCDLLRSFEPITATNLVSELPEDGVPCVNGFVYINEDEKYPCHRVDLLARLSRSDLNDFYGQEDDRINDLWGWTGPQGQEIVMMGTESGTSFVDISNPGNLLYLGVLPSHTERSLWRDIKTYRHYAYIVSEAKTHGLQVIDLNRMIDLDVSEVPKLFTEDAHLPSFHDAHNLFINEDTAFAYVVGSNRCDGGLYILDISSPLDPQWAGCFPDDGYTHDVQCMYYMEYFGYVVAR